MQIKLVLKLDEPPSPKILKKIAFASNSVTSYYELMKVCGYLSAIDIEHLINSDNFTDIIENNVKHNGHLLITMDFDTADFSEQEKEILNKYIELWNKNKKVNINDLIAGLYDNSKGKILREYKKFHQRLNELAEKNKAVHKEQSNVFPTADIPKKIPVLGKISAGLPLLAVENIEDYWYAPSSKIQGGYDDFYLRVQRR